MAKFLNFLTAIAVGIAIAFMAANGGAYAQVLSTGSSPGTLSVFPYTFDTRTSSFLTGHLFQTGGTLLQTATGPSGYILVAGTTVELQIDGVATSLSGQLQRSAQNPAFGGGVWAPVGSAQSGVNPSTGVAPITATEYGVAWYRYNVTALTGTSVNITLSSAVY